MPLILVSNDDSIYSRGIAFLVQCMQPLGQVVVVAPDTHMSGKSHSITLGEPLRLKKSKLFGDDVEAYECNGTPVDCVKMGKHLVCKDRKIDLIVSGVNHGSNSSVSVLYSGTMGAALEGALENIPSIGFSLTDISPQAHFEHTREFLMKITQDVLREGLPKGVALNVNFPAVCDESIKDILVTRQSESYYKEHFIEKKDPYGRPYYWLDGNFERVDMRGDTDEWALEHNYVSVTPCQTDLTAYEHRLAIEIMFEEKLVK